MRIVQENEHASVIIERNLVSAAKASLLLLPESFNAQEFYTTVAGLSYTGERTGSHSHQGAARGGGYVRPDQTLNLGLVYARPEFQYFEVMLCVEVWIRA